MSWWKRFIFCNWIHMSFPYSSSSTTTSFFSFWELCLYLFVYPLAASESGFGVWLLQHHQFHVHHYTLLNNTREGDFFWMYKISPTGTICICIPPPPRETGRENFNSFFFRFHFPPTPPILVTQKNSLSLSDGPTRPTGTTAVDGDVVYRSFQMQERTPKAQKEKGKNTHTHSKKRGFLSSNEGVLTSPWVL